MNDVKKYLTYNSNKIRINSKDVKKNDVFVALSGSKAHGNNYITEAINNGAKYIITDKVFEKKLGNINIIVVKNTLIFLENIAKQKRELYKGVVIGITGSVGKTSVKENLKFFLKNYFNVSASIKSYNNYLGVIISLLNMDLESNFAIFEIGTNNFLEIQKLTSIVMPSQVVITNIYPTHLENLINTRNIAIEKSDILNINYNPKVKLAIISNNNIDEKYIVNKALNFNSFDVISFGKDKNSNFKISKVIEIDKYYSKIYLDYDNKKINFILNKAHLHRVNNILICIIIFIYNNIKLELILNLTKDLPLLEGRGLNKKIKIYNKSINLIDESYNASPQTMRVCIEYFSNLKLNPNQKKILILGEMKELGANAIKFHIKLLNYLLEKKLEHVIICGELMQIALKKTGNRKILCMMDLKSILEYINKNICEKDIILVKGSNSSLTNILTKKLLSFGEN
tara:strand:+ start:2575 stop:3942 length:1368 start_codon:yes stop_codon:yes gene_type:complete